MKTNYSVSLTSTINDSLFSHLIRSDGQEDLCFATYLPSTGSVRHGGIIQEIILPKKGERIVHGNVGFMPDYFERALKIAADRKEGLAFIHSHPGPGWQGMSSDDVMAEKRIAPATFALTRLPLLGLTLGTDGAWSARYWEKNLSKKRVYVRHWCEVVKVVGKQLKITFNDFILPPRFDSGKQLRTISAWGKETQEDLSRLKIGIVGLGSVGSIVAEILARTGFSNFVLIDFDSVEEKNLDRLTGVFKKDIGKAKVRVIKAAIKRSATSPMVKINTVEYSICEKEGFDASLNCDVLFSCVDRPWPRQVLNFISYAHLIPVIDGGIFVRTNKKNTKIIGADWKAQTIGIGRACLECLGQYKTDNAILERAGKIDDPDYIKGMADKSFFEAHENVFVFSSHLASMEVQQLLSLFMAPSGIADVGQQMYHFTTGKLDVENNKRCHDNCFFPTITGKGDYSGVTVYSAHPIAEKARQLRM
ncbi:MAG TPA: ThiF family adenylyltransferase [Bacteroidia bacterium]|nr:ThiF family adenylyltransferase [Bacteroidia bacterium]